MDTCKKVLYADVNGNVKDLFFYFYFSYFFSIFKHLDSSRFFLGVNYPHPPLCPYQKNDLFLHFLTPFFPLRHFPLTKIPVFGGYMCSMDGCMKNYPHPPLSISKKTTLFLHFLNALFFPSDTFPLTKIPVFGGHMCSMDAYKNKISKQDHQSKPKLTTFM